MHKVQTYRRKNHLKSNFEKTEPWRGWIGLIYAKLGFGHKFGRQLVGDLDCSASDCFKKGIEDLVDRMF